MYIQVCTKSFASCHEVMGSTKTINPKGLHLTWSNICPKF